MKRLLVFCFGFCSFAVLGCEEHSIDCDKAYSTYEINQCAAIELDKAKQQLADYLEAALKHHNGDAELVEAIKTAQHDWERYANTHCQAIYTLWRDGTIRTVAALACKTQLTKERTFELWQDFLTSTDSAASMLPEPSL